MRKATTGINSPTLAQFKGLMAVLRGSIERVAPPTPESARLCEAESPVQSADLASDRAFEALRLTAAALAVFDTWRDWCVPGALLIANVDATVTAIDAVNITAATSNAAAVDEFVEPAK